MASNRLDWVVDPSYGRELQPFGPGTQSPPTGQFFPVTILLGVGVGFEGFADAEDIHEFEQNRSLTLLRVRGQVLYRITSTESFILHERIMVGVQDITDGSVATPVDGTDSEDAEDPFLWERLSWVEAHTTGVGHYPEQADHPWWTNIDVKSKRRLQRGFCVLYSVAVDTPVTLSMGLQHSMRTLCKR